MRAVQTVALCGLGAIGLEVARRLDAGVEGLRLIAVSARDQAAAKVKLSAFNAPPPVVPLSELARADVVVEAAPAAIFADVAVPAIEAGRILIPASVGALLKRMDLIERARQTGARILPPTGALLGLDAIRAVAEGPVESITLESRKPPLGYAGAPWVVANHIDLATMTVARRIFRGSADEAARSFPANANVAAALARLVRGLSALRGLVSTLKSGS